ncbi:zinc-dependent peptidase [Paucibacter sp. DJ2R-2]|uniref:M90 family metallopeptidase n=1 Tax=Paucibacter sp. DJ2R-2 TaxID=2893558 RepID=UPI0021E47686|nr:M90 family metallopeptidase [Paucibacter sp. DJ2R-2]MCV2422177.1 zinc-dependent peptidase [Paucibacter sp. DJ4R-1]MCV2440239.1 zinc-dependent peptidase [Paucibacter sp. DJ2R-2]
MFSWLRRLKWLGEAWTRRRDRLTVQRLAIPEPLWQLTLLRYPFLAERSEEDLSELRRLCSLFLDRKEFHGAGGFEVSDEVAIAVAAQACLPVLRLGLDWYEGFVGIVMHEDEVLARREFTDEDGVVHAFEEELAGEAMEGGPLMLVWQAMAADTDPAADRPDSIYNVVIHEFAHVIDMRDGWADGVPPLASLAAREQWLDVIEAEWQAFCQRVDTGEATLIDPYGAESLEEFFAVAVEAFFVAPKALRAEQAPLYRLLARFFRQDPAA